MGNPEFLDTEQFDHCHHVIDSGTIVRLTELPIRNIVTLTEIVFPATPASLDGPQIGPYITDSSVSYLAS
jgi:hypothetical protein